MPGNSESAALLGAGIPEEAADGQAEMPYFGERGKAFPRNAIQKSFSRTKDYSGLFEQLCASNGDNVTSDARGITDPSQCMKG